ncbi:MAG: DUF1223 domain-containing protein [Alphaproteobacteria bacterium]|nr:DUF1223 domain-containing protein [Alphaproteobacteria bacterium]
MREAAKRGWAILVLVSGASLAPGGTVFAQEADSGHPVLVEMFLSQACRQSPPAADYLTQLRARPDVVVLDWHVDYWNMLSSGKKGRWADPFSDAEFSKRQRAYNRRIRHKDMVFTPQAIIGGEVSAVGSSRAEIEMGIATQRASGPNSETIEIAKDAGKLAIAVRGDESAEIYLVTFRKWATTDVTGGDNAGMTFLEPNIVTGAALLGVSSSTHVSFEAPTPAEGSGCAVIAQKPGQGKVLAARYCP